MGWRGSSRWRRVRGKYTPFSVVKRARRPNTGLCVQGDLHVKAPGMTKGWKGAGQDLDNPFLFWWVVCFHAVRYWAASPLQPHLLSPLVHWFTFSLVLFSGYFLYVLLILNFFMWIGVMNQSYVKRRLEQLLSWLRIKAKQHHAWELLCITKEVTKPLGQLEYLYKHSNEGIQAVINYAYCVGKYLQFSLILLCSKCGTRA